MRRHWRTRVHFHVKELVRVCSLGVQFVQVLALHTLRAERRHARIDLTRLRAGDAEFFGDGAEVKDLDDHRRVGALLQHGFRRPTPRFDARLRVEFDNE